MTTNAGRHSTAAAPAGAAVRTASAADSPAISALLEGAPSAVRTHEQFPSLCPSTATVMALRLGA